MFQLSISIPPYCAVHEIGMRKNWGTPYQGSCAHSIDVDPDTCIGTSSRQKFALHYTPARRIRRADLILASQNLAHSQASKPGTRKLSLRGYLDLPDRHRIAESCVSRKCTRCGHMAYLTPKPLNPKPHKSLNPKPVNLTPKPLTPNPKPLHP